MAKSKGKVADGMVLLMDSAPIAELIRVTPSKKTRKQVDLTNHESPDNYEETVKGRKKSEPLQSQVTYEKDVRATLDAAFEDEDEHAFELQYPDGSKDNWTGFISELGPETPLGERMTCSLAIAVNGKVTYAAA